AAVAARMTTLLGVIESSYPSAPSEKFASAFTNSMSEAEFLSEALIFSGKPVERCKRAASSFASFLNSASAWMKVVDVNGNVPSRTSTFIGAGMMGTESAAKIRNEKAAMNVARTIVFMRHLSVSALEVLLAFFQRFSLRLPQEKCRGEKIDDRATREYEKHCGITVLANRGQKDSGNGGGDGDVDEQGDAHSLGANPGGHQFRKRQPDTDPRPNGEKRHETINQNGRQPAVLLRGHGRDDGVLDFQRRCARSIQIREGIFEKGRYLALRE